MDLFIDKYYENEVKNKLNYYEFINNYASLVHTLQSPFSLVIEEGKSRTIFKYENVILVRTNLGSSVDGVHVKDGAKYLQEYRLADNLKKFIIE
jgi:hypothetical protein